MKYCPNPDCPFRERVHEPAEYEDRATKCSDCGSALVDEKPDFSNEPRLEWEKMVPVMPIAEASVVPVIESLLQSAGIPHFIHGEGVQELIGLGRIGAGFNVLAGEAVLFVDSERVDEARRLLVTTEGVPDPPSSSN